MATTILNPLLRASIAISDLPPRLLFKPHFIYDSFLTSSKLSKHKLCKRNYRFIHSLQINEERRCIKIISNLKSISSLDFYSRGEINNFPLLERLFKSHQKCLKSLGKRIRYFRFLRLLPLLTHLQMSRDHAHWRLLTSSRSAFKTLIFDLQDSSKQTTQNFLKYKAALRRNLPKMRALNSLKIKAFNEDTDLILSLLEIINEKGHLESLKDFDLSIKPSNDLQDHPKILELKPVKIDRALQYLTKLSIDDSGGYYFLLSLAKFNNLSNLQLKYCPEEESSGFRLIAHLKDLPKLKKFTLSFQVRSFPCEFQFFEQFVAPSSLEHLDLTLYGFEWTEWSEMTGAEEDSIQTLQENFENDPQYIQFFERIQNCCHNVKTLKLSIQCAEKIHAAVTGRFASLFIQRSTKLEQIDFQSNQYEHSNSEEDDPMKQPLDLQDVWKGLQSFKETLISISIQADIIGFPENIEALQTRFPRLESFNLRGEILCPVGLGAFCCSIPSLKSIIMRDPILTDKESLKKFIFSWRNIPQGVKVELCLNIEGIRQLDFIDCLEEYIQNMRIRGELKMYFVQVRVIHIMAFERILNEATKKGCFEELSLVSNVGRLMFLIKKNVVQCKIQGLRVS